MAKNNDEKKIVKAARNIDEEIWKEYFPEMKDTTPPVPGCEFIWLESDIPEIILRSKKGASITLDDLKKEIESMPLGKSVSKRLNFDKIQKNIDIRKNWAEALKNSARGHDLCPPLDYALSAQDMKELAELHKMGKFRKKIEELLVDVNFHSACSDFTGGKYEQYLT